jgi:hypothetical protein
MLAAAYINVCRHSNTHRALLKCFTVSKCARNFSITRNFDPSIREFVSRLAQKQPSFKVASKDVHVLSQPSEFYENLLVSILESTLCEIFQRVDARISSVVQGGGFFCRHYTLVSQRQNWYAHHTLYGEKIFLIVIR